MTHEAGISKYEVYRDGVLIGSPTLNTFDDTGLTANTTYEYEIIAIDTNFVSSRTTTLSVTTASV